MIDFILSYWWFFFILAGMLTFNGLYLMLFTKGVSEGSFKEEAKKAPANILAMLILSNCLLAAILVALLMIHSKL